MAEDQEQTGDRAEAGAEDMRAALAAQLLQLRPRDLLAQTAVMLANQAAIRMGMASPEHADREQAREAIDALAGVVELLAPTAGPRSWRRCGATSRSCAWRSCSPQRAAPAAARTPAAEEPPADEGPARSARRSGRRAARSDPEASTFGRRACDRLAELDAGERRAADAVTLRRTLGARHKRGRIRRM